MRKAILLIFFCAFTTKVFSQAFVFDKKTQKPISDVAVYTEDHEVFELSQMTGKVDLNRFKQGETLIFRHPAYREFSTTLTELELSDYKVYLEEKIIRIDEVVVSANKWEQDVEELANEVITISPEEIRFNNPQTAADLLESTGKLFVQKSQFGGGSPMMRGFGANAVLIVVDGVRMNNAIFRGGNLQNIINIDPAILEGAEVILGPGSVIYGSDALGGVMDFHTREIDLSDFHRPFKTHAVARFSSASLETTGHLDWLVSKKTIGWLGSFSFSNFGDLRSGAGRPHEYPDFGKRLYEVERINGVDSMVTNKNPNVQTPSAFYQFNTLQKLKWQASPNFDFQYTFILSTTGNIPRYDRLIEEENGQAVNAQWYYGPQFWMMNSLRLHSGPTRFWDQANFIATRQDFEESRNDRKYGSTRLRSRTEEVTVYSLNWDANKKNFLDQEYYYGFEYSYNNVRSSAVQTDITTGETFPLSTRYPNRGSHVHSAAGYFSMKYDVLPFATLNAGIRYSLYHLEAHLEYENFPFDVIENQHSSLNGNLGAVTEVTPDLRLNVVASTGFRAPNVDDVAKIFDSEPGNVVVPNPDLKPEYTFNMEGGFEWHVAKDLTLNAQAFHSWLKDAMVRADFTFNGQDSIEYDGKLSNVQAYVNTGRAIAYGFDTKLQWEIDNYWAFETYFNFTRGKDLASGEPIRHMTPAFGRSSLFFKKGKIKTELFSRYNGRISYENLPPSEKNKPHIYTDAGSLPWFTLNLRTHYQVSNSWDIHAAVENILDKHYRTYSSGISAPGINFVLSVHAHF